MLYPTSKRIENLNFYSFKFYLGFRYFLEGLVRTFLRQMADSDRFRHLLAHNTITPKRSTRQKTERGKRALPILQPNRQDKQIKLWELLEGYLGFYHVPSLIRFFSKKGKNQVWEKQKNFVSEFYQVRFLRPFLVLANLFHFELNSIHKRPLFWNYLDFNFKLIFNYKFIFSKIII